jgi:Kef-type K+ transport system membrane component KefB
MILSPALSLDLDLLIVLAAAVGTAIAARVTRLPITGLEIVAGIALVSLVAFRPSAGLDSLVVFGSLLIVFLAGLETRWDFLKENLRSALSIGVPGFLVPFAGLLVLFLFGFHLPLFLSVIGATALADTSISIVYTTLHQYQLANLPFGRMVLASTLMVNLLEDSTITGATVLNGPAVALTVVILAALAAVAFLLPRADKWIGDRFSSTFSNIPTRALLVSLLLIGTLSLVVNVPGILFVFLMGLVFSRYASPTFVRDIQRFAFAVFVPLYFVAVGLHVDIGFVVAHLPALLAIVGLASLLKVVAIYPSASRRMADSVAAPVAVLMNARLTSATVILLLTLTLGILPQSWYSLFISAVVILALGSSLLLLAFPVFRSEESARLAFAGFTGARRPGPAGSSQPSVTSDPGAAQVEET